MGRASTAGQSHPQTTPGTVEKIKARAAEHPSRGCNRLEALLRLEGIGVSSVTIRKILSDADLGTRYDRWLALEAKNAEKAIELTAEQAAFLERMNRRGQVTSRMTRGSSQGAT